MISRKAVIDQISVLSNHVYEEVERFKNDLNINELEKKSDVERVRLGKAMFQMREKDLSMLKEDPSILVLVEKIQENRKQNVLDHKNNSYLSKYYHALMNLINKI